MKKTSVLFVLVFILINIRTVYSQEDIKSPFLLKEINISTSGIDKTGNISLRTEIVEDGEVSLKIFNSLGEEVRTLVNEIKPAGNYEVEFNASELPSGIYIYSIQAGEFISSKKMILLK